jgi:melibiose permease
MWFQGNGRIKKMGKAPVENSGKLTFKEKYSFGLGAIGKDMVYGIIATYAMIYLTDVTKISAAFVGTMFFVAKFWDAINDLFMGMFVDNTRTRWGKFKPWLIIGTLLNSIVLIMFFTKLPWQGTALYVAVSVLYVLWGMTYTIMDIPYWSMIPNLTQDPKEREEVSVIPRVFAAIGQMLIVGGLGLPIMNALGGGQIGYTKFAWIIVLVFIASTTITCLGVRNQNNLVSKEEEKAEKTTIKDAVRAITQNDQLLVTILIILTFNLTVNFAQGSLLYYFKYVTGNANLFAYYTFSAGIATVVGLILFPKLAQKLSRRTVYILAGALPAAGLMLLFAGSYIAPQSLAITIIAGFIFSVGQGLQQGSVTVLLADTVDYGEYKFGKRNESVTFSCQTLLVKFTSAFATMLIGWALTLTGYIPDAVQTPATMMGIRIVALIVPAVFALVSMFIYLKYLKLNTTFMKKIINTLDLRKEKKIEVETGVSAIPAAAMAEAQEYEEREKTLQDAAFAVDEVTDEE